MEVLDVDSTFFAMLCSRLYLNSLGYLKRGEIITELIASLFVFSIIVIILEFEVIILQKRVFSSLKFARLEWGQVFKYVKGETAHDEDEQSNQG